MSRRLRGWVIVAGVAAAIGAVALVIALLGSRSSGCTLAAPAPELPDRLRVTGDFDRPYDPSDGRTVEDVALRAATALHPDLIGTTPQPAVEVRAASGDRHDALVVPLTAEVTGARPAHLAGLVAFLRDCGGRAYFSEVSDLSGVTPPLASFPTVTREDAAARLGAAGAVLVYRDSPLRPSWRDASTGRELAAG